MAEAKTHHGSCHCGNVKYEVTTDLAKVMECNCSHCSRKGFLLTFVPAEQFKLLAGEDATTTYHFHKRHIDHMFCKTCGVQSYARAKSPDGKETYAVNARCLEGVEPSTLTITPVNGRAF
ncbi:MAG: Gfa-like protein [Myxococcales bacterium]|nr:Gfa-like protein [Myxococcales bacterium]